MSMRISTPTTMCKEMDGYSKRTYVPKTVNILKLKLFLKEDQKDGNNTNGNNSRNNIR